MTLWDLDDVWGNGLTPIEVRIWDDGDVGGLIWSGIIEELYTIPCGRNRYIRDMFIDQLTCGLIVSIDHEKGE